MARWLALPLTVSAAAVVSLPPDHPAQDPAEISFNDNRVPGGRLQGGEYSLDLVIRKGQWHVLGPDQPAAEVLAFAEAGKPLSNPGPLIRVPLGTRLRIRVRNEASMPLAVRGLGSRKVPALDTLLVAPGATAEARFTADAPGTYYYWGGAPGRGLVGPRGSTRRYEDSQLNGAFIVDSSRTAPAPDRVLVVSLWTTRRLPNGGPDLNSELYLINGRPWPLTERMTYTMGDSVRWHVINASADVHPLHLHGFYFRVDSRGDMARDTIYWPGDRRMAVTERLTPGTTMSMAWSPDRPGGWVFHCHLTFHVVSNPGIGPAAASREERAREILFGHAHTDPAHHVEQGMGGLMLGLTVRPLPGWKPSTVERRTLRLFVQSDSTASDSVRRFGYVLQEGDAEPKADSVRRPGSTLVLHQGEPTAIWVINRTAEPTAVHWHGMEIESPFDGVVGVGGYPGSPTPPIMPGDSFLVRMTPPRAGTFMYHTHVNDVRQLRGGLWAPLIVLPAGQSLNTAEDLLFITGEAKDFGPVLNGSTTHPDIPLVTGKRYRLRLMNITAGTPNLQYWLSAPGPSPVWTPVARDGFELPPWQRTPRRAEEYVSMGQTVDVEFVAPGEGPFVLELRNGAGVLITRQPFTLMKP